MSVRWHSIRSTLSPDSRTQPRDSFKPVCKHLPIVNFDWPLHSVHTSSALPFYHCETLPCSLGTVSFSGVHGWWGAQFGPHRPTGIGRADNFSAMPVRADPEKKSGSHRQLSQAQHQARPDNQLTMVETYGKKRKRVADSAATSKKKVTIAGPPATVSVSKLVIPKSCPPVIGMMTLGNIL